MPLYNERVSVIATMAGGLAVCDEFGDCGDGLDPLDKFDVNDDADNGWGGYAYGCKT